MTQLSLDFHALPAELIDLIASFVRSEHLNLAVVTYPPFRARQVQATDLAAFLGGRSALRVVITPESIDVSATNIRDMLDRNPDALVVDIGQESPEGLGESAMSTASDDDQRLALWRRFAKRIKATTEAGATAIDPATGGETRVRSHRHTAGARAAQKAGVAMLPMAGVVRLRFD